jgi:Pectate lyase superfamily protein
MNDRGADQCHISLFKLKMVQFRFVNLISFLFYCVLTMPTFVRSQPLVRSSLFEITRGDIIHRTTDGVINVKEFGAKGDGLSDDYIAIQNACNYCIMNPAFCTSVRIPVGNYHISHPIILKKVANANWQFFTIKIVGDAPAKSASNEYLSTITATFNSGFAIGIQKGRGIQIENLNISGQYTFPNTINNYNIGTTRYAAWNDGSVHDSRFAPYAGIDIDPFCDSNYITAAEGYPEMRNQYLPGTGRGGTSGVEILQCSIHNFPVGIMLTPNGYTQNDELINIIDDNIDAVKVAIAIGQDQSKTILIENYKCWASTYTILDGLSYGAGTGGGSVYAENWNIAGNANQLFNLNTSRFPLSAKDIFSESLFRLGYVGGGAGSNFINFEIDFLTGPGLPEADYLLIGQANFYGGMLRYYDNDRGHRLNFVMSTMRYCLMFRDMVMNNPPLISGLYGMPFNKWNQPIFDNVAGYYTPFKNNFDTLIQITALPPVIDRRYWVGTIYGAGLGKKAIIGDYILGEPTSTTCKYYDNEGYCVTRQIGRVTAIKGDTLILNNVGLNVFSNSAWERMYISRLR